MSKDKVVKLRYGTEDIPEQLRDLAEKIKKRRSRENRRHSYHFKK